LLSDEGSPWVTSLAITKGMFSGKDVTGFFFFDDIGATDLDLFKLEMHFDLDVLWWPEALISVFSIGWINECRKGVNTTKNKRTHEIKLSDRFHLSYKHYSKTRIFANLLLIRCNRTFQQAHPFKLTKQ